MVTVSNDWRDTWITIDTSIRDAVIQIDKTCFNVCLVVDCSEKLIATVTDGDVRRGIIKGITLDQPVSYIIKQNPTFVTAGTPREKIFKLMRSSTLRHIPVVDDQGKLVGLETLASFVQYPKKSNRVVLMAGGLGKRLRPLTNDVPKPMLPIGDKPILEIILEQFIEYGFEEFFLSVNYKAAKIEEHFSDGQKWGVNIGYIHEKDRLGTAGALSKLPKNNELPIIVMNGDLLTSINFSQLLDYHIEHKSAATMGVREYDFKVPYGVVDIHNNMIQHIKEKPIHRFFVNAGVYVFNPDVLQFIPKDAYFDMNDFFNKLVSVEKRTVAFPVREYWLDIGQIDDYNRANSEFAERFSST